jgi:hypothetical protein
MERITVQARSAAPSEEREFVARLERLQRRLAALAAAAEASERELRRQRAAGRRP